MSKKAAAAPPETHHTKKANPPAGQNGDQWYLSVMRVNTSVKEEKRKVGDADFGGMLSP